MSSQWGYVFVCDTIADGIIFMSMLVSEILDVDLNESSTCFLNNLFAPARAPSHPDSATEGGEVVLFPAVFGFVLARKKALR